MRLKRHYIYSAFLTIETSGGIHAAQCELDEEEEDASIPVFEIVF